MIHLSKQKIIFDKFYQLLDKHCRYSDSNFFYNISNGIENSELLALSKNRKFKNSINITCEFKNNTVSFSIGLLTMKNTSNISYELFYDGKTLQDLEIANHIYYYLVVKLDVEGYKCY